MPLDTTPATEILDPEAAQSVAGAATPAPAVAPAPEATTAKPETPAEPTSALDAALKALAKTAEPDPVTAAQPAGENTAPAESTQQGQPEDAQDESLADVPRLAPDVFSALPKEARTAFNQLRKQVGSLRPDAERGQAVAKFLAASGITPQEFMELQDVGALMKRDPAKAREVLLQHLDRLDTALGVKLPDDLKQDVDGGYISEDRAAELSRERARARALEQAVVERDAQATSAALAAAVDSWEARTRGADPDMDRKLPNIMREVKLALHERAAAGKPVRSAEEAVAIAQASYEAVNEMLKPFRAASAPVPRAPSSAASSAPASNAPPSTALEAAWAAVRGGVR